MIAQTNERQMPTSKPQKQPLGKTEKLLQDVRKMPLFHQLIPLEASVGWPIPLRKDGLVYIISLLSKWETPCDF